MENGKEQPDTPGIEGSSARAARIASLQDAEVPVPENWPTNVAPPEGTSDVARDEHYRKYQESGGFAEETSNAGIDVPENWPTDIAPPEGTSDAAKAEHYRKYQESDN